MRQLARAAMLAAAGAVAVTGLGLAAAPGALAADIYSRPAIAIVGGNPVIAAQSRDDGLWFYWQQNGTRTWHPEQVAAAGTTFSEPAVTQVGDSTVIVAEGVFNTLDFYWQTIGTKPWHPETVAGTYSTYSAPDIIANPGNVNVVAQGPGNTLRRYWQANGTPEWHPDTVTGSTVVGPPSITFQIRNGAPELHVIDQSLSNYLIDFADVNASPTWKIKTVQNAGFADSPATATSNAGSVDVAVTGPDGFLYFYYETKAGTFSREAVNPPTL
ncbi:MAG TPA: hypothetical protein VHZ33_39700 [Trebonia sp.]|jgi:hypothetical protein|nr:hypothetical protein [Trebonia sp.]